MKNVTMTKSKFWLGMLVMALVFGMTVVGCDDEIEPEPDTPPHWQPGGSTINPIDRVADTNLGTMTSSASGWRQLLNSINDTGKYINLDLSACTMTGTSFNPDASVETGKKYIVSIILPSVAMGIETGTYSDPAFKSFTNLKSISGANIITIGDYSFFGNYSYSYLQSVNFPQATSIGNSAFSSCSRLQIASFPQVTTIGESAFSSCYDIQGVSFPQATSIGNSAFSSCSRLQIANFPLLTTIGESAFSSCGNLASVNIPKVTSIGDDAFRGTSTTALTVTMGSTVPTLRSDMFSAINTTKTVTVKVPAGAMGYTPFNGTTVTVSGTDTTANWANGFRRGGWNGTTWAAYGGTSHINQNINLVIQQQ